MAVNILNILNREGKIDLSKVEQLKDDAIYEMQDSTITITGKVIKDIIVAKKKIKNEERT